MPWEKNKSLDDRPFTINQSYYNSRGIERQLVSLSEPFNIGGVSGIMITIYPFNYNPKDNELAITSSGTFEIILNDPVETEAMIGLGMACSIIVFVGAGIIMMIIGFLRRSRERAETVEAERLVRITRKAEQMMAEDKMRDEE